MSSAIHDGGEGGRTGTKSLGEQKTGSSGYKTAYRTTTPRPPRRELVVGVDVVVAVVVVVVVVVVVRIWSALLFAWVALGLGDWSGLR